MISVLAQTHPLAANMNVIYIFSSFTVVSRFCFVGFFFVLTNTMLLWDLKIIFLPLIKYLSTETDKLMVEKIDL